ncbi:MarR family transcriptional regulator [Streptomyces sp. AJS327]|uniref:MarR family winged helix-turn-helix transcriptional regulator n=1 Tax=Streptomyces sp. AJS327 TaxID=2545265 RepID=UPI0015DFEA6F|nr:MarR family transcriptional regulator [Streptomyces sp. AJS327]MBA0052691.1 MarR family transcriptional regulator [Streptomyces sp. AJS327]
MAARGLYEELARQLSAVGVVKREMARELPGDCPPASVGVLMLLHKHGEMRISRLTELLAIDMSVTSRHVTHVAERGWIERHPDPQDGRSRLLRLSEGGEQLLQELSRRTAETLERQLREWSDEDVARLATLLQRLRDSFGDGRARLPQQGAGAAVEPPGPPERPTAKPRPD